LKKGELVSFGDRTGVALVTGGSGGIGQAVCRQLAKSQSDLAFTYFSNKVVADSLCREVQAMGRRCSAHQIDLRDSAACATLVEQLLTEYGGVHTLVHAAGPHVPMTHLSEVTPAEMGDQVESDLMAFYNVVHPLLPALRNSQGSIVAVTTVATSRFPRRDGLSSVPKATVEAIVRALAGEEGRFGVRANCVGPGMLTDGMASRLIESRDLDDEALLIARTNIPLGRFGKADDIAHAVEFLASDRANYITGQKLDVDGGYAV
jgi:NAD(P)-dependent dehydrogenase (short-subunit alcohol dehydrogenase family)